MTTLLFALNNYKVHDKVSRDLYLQVNRNVTFSSLTFCFDK